MTTSTTNPFLPQELLETIVSHLSSNNLALRACLQAGRPFRIACEAALFRTVILLKSPTLSFAPYTTRSHAASDPDFIRGLILFASSRTLAKFIRSLTIQLSGEPSEGRLVKTILQRVHQAGVLESLVVVPGRLAVIPSAEDPFAALLLQTMTLQRLQRLELQHVPCTRSLDYLVPSISDSPNFLEWEKVHLSLRVEHVHGLPDGPNLASLAPIFAHLRNIHLCWCAYRYFLMEP
ncbi:hypothetical protein HMN09_00356400 [Mycena chlorophos]|uniref:F-box domain-containing protein n=1 Tax=Mycena chlorophos TaxID=658473 RepID=A0A8H6TKP8_MYCCL|nr:hypothetical protein HMN09_00356400 [Mycena chlorophos]